MNRFDLAVARAVYQIGELVGEFDPRGRWHFSKWTNGCVYNRVGSCCHACFVRFLLERVRGESSSTVRRSHYSGPEEDGEEQREFVMIEVKSPDRGEGQ